MEIIYFESDSGKRVPIFQYLPEFFKDWKVETDSKVNFSGKVSLSWRETRPRLIIADPELMRLILADKNGDFVKPPLNPLVHILQRGVSKLEGKRWAKRRRLITPAFHLEKLKVDHSSIPC